MIRNPINNRPLLTAAFIGAGMHLSIPRLDAARAAIDTGCLELVEGAMNYVPYIEALYDAASALAEVQGVFEYEVCEPFGTWYVDEVLRHDHLEGHPADWPGHEATMAKLVELVFEFFARDVKDSSVLLSALTGVARPEEFDH